MIDLSTRSSLKRSVRFLPYLLMIAYVSLSSDSYAQDQTSLPTKAKPVLTRGQAKETEGDPWLDTFWSVAKQVKNKRAQRAITEVLKDPKKFRFQLLITEYDKDSDGVEHLTPHVFRVDQEYFYPASAIKTYASIAALRHFTLLRQKHKWLTTDDPMSPETKTCQKADKTNELSALASLEHEIKKTQLISSNQAFNTVFDVTGFRQLHEYILPDFPSVRVYHRLSSRETHEESLRTPGLHICDLRKGKINPKNSFMREKFTSQKEISDLVEAVAQERPQAPTGFGENRESLLIGQSYKDMKTKKLIKKPMDFSFKNRVSFFDFQRLNMAMYMPNRATDFGPAVKLLSVEAKSDSELEPLIRKVWLSELRHAMAIYPRHSKNPKYSGASLSETRFKPLIRGVRMADKKRLNDEDLYYLNKAGKALGFHMDNAFIAYGKEAGGIRENGFPKRSPRRGLFITVGFYVNEDGTLNNDKYEYKKISVPALDAIGYAVGRYLIGDWPQP